MVIAFGLLYVRAHGLPGARPTADTSPPLVLEAAQAQAGTALRQLWFPDPTTPAPELGRLHGSFQEAVAVLAQDPVRSLPLLEARLRQPRPGMADELITLQLLWEIGTPEAQALIARQQSHPDETVARTARAMTARSAPALQDLRHFRIAAAR
jgi:hypothetical protein